MLLNIHNEESLRIRNKKFSSEWPIKHETFSFQQQMYEYYKSDVDITSRLHNIQAVIFGRSQY
jgi:hypothetical protein